MKNGDEEIAEGQMLVMIITPIWLSFLVIAYIVVGGGYD